MDRLTGCGTVASADALQYTSLCGGGRTARLEVFREPGETGNSGDVAARVDAQPVLLLRNNGADVPEDDDGTVGTETQTAIAVPITASGARRGKCLVA